MDLLGECLAQNLDLGDEQFVVGPLSSSRSSARFRALAQRSKIAFCQSVALKLARMSAGTWTQAYSAIWTSLSWLTTSWPRVSSISRRTSAALPKFFQPLFFGCVAGDFTETGTLV